MFVLYVNSSCSIFKTLASSCCPSGLGGGGGGGGGGGELRLGPNFVPSNYLPIFMGAHSAYSPWLFRRTINCDCGVSQRLSPVRVHGPMPMSSLCIFYLDPEAINSAQWTETGLKLYLEVDNWLFSKPCTS